jgi:hypothetical protein
MIQILKVVGSVTVIMFSLACIIHCLAYNTVLGTGSLKLYGVCSVWRAEIFQKCKSCIMLSFSVKCPSTLSVKNLVPYEIL